MSCVGRQEWAAVESMPRLQSRTFDVTVARSDGRWYLLGHRVFAVTANSFCQAAEAAIHRLNLIEQEANKDCDPSDVYVYYPKDVVKMEMVRNAVLVAGHDPDTGKVVSR